MLGYLIQRKPPPIGGYGLKDFGYFSIYIFIPFFLIAKEPDLGTALVLLLVGYGILFIIGVNWKIWLGIVFILSIFLPFSYNYIMKDYQKKMEQTSHVAITVALQIKPMIQQTRLLKYLKTFGRKKLTLIVLEKSHCSSCLIPLLMADFCSLATGTSELMALVNTMLLAILTQHSIRTQR
jgi:cell division protein FtsW (lipid II flippase)